MIHEVFARYTWLWPLVWQSTLCVTAGLAGSFLLRRRAACAHQVLLLGLVAAVLIPALSQIVKRNQWGLLVAERAVPTAQRQPAAAPVDFVIPDRPVVTEPVNVPSLVGGLETAPAPAHTEFDWARAVLPTWLIIGSLLLLRLAIQFLLGRRLAQRSEGVEDSAILQMVEHAKDKLGLRTTVEVRASTHTRSPVIWCWTRRPILLIPPASRRSDDGLDWQSVFCHELAHAKRRDHISGLFAELMICVLPWQPLLWWARQRLASLSEEACDDWVIASGQRPTGYARTLLGLTAQSQAAFIPGVVTTRRGLAGRIRRVMEDGCGNPRPSPRWTLGLAILAGCLSLGLAFTQTRPAALDAQTQTADSEILPPAEITSDDPFDYFIPDSMVRFWLTDPNGRPIAGATVGTYALVREGVSPDRPNRASAPTSDERGEVLFDIAGVSTRKIFGPGDLGEVQTKELPRGAVYVLQKEQNLGAIHGLTNADAGKSFNVRLRPLCRVQGTLSSPDLPATMPVHEIHMEVQWQKIQVLQQSGEERKIDFWLPPGEYVLTLRGRSHRSKDGPSVSASTHEERRPFTIRAGERNLDLGDIKLRPTRIATMIGRSAPELGPIQAWKNGPPVTMAQLRGQVVLLYFGGERPFAREIASLAKLHDTFGDKGLTILAIFNCASMEELEQTWPRFDPKYGQMEKVPFHLALDGGEPTRNEATGQMRRGATYGKYDIHGSAMVLLDQAGKVAGEYPSGEGTEVIRQMLGRQIQNAGPRAETAHGAQEQTAIREDKILLRLVGADGRPVAGARVATIIVSRAVIVGDDVPRAHWLPSSFLPSDEHGRVVLAVEALSRLPQDKVTVYVVHEEQGIGTMQEFGQGSLSEPLPIVLKPLCRLHGIADSAGLAALGMPLRSIDVTIQSSAYPQTVGTGPKWPRRDFALFVPPGAAVLTLSGRGSKEEDSPFLTADTERKSVSITVPEGQADFDVGVIDLRPMKWADLIGHPAPEIGPMKAWKNGSAVTLAQFRGQIVWLHFGGEYPNVSREIPELVRLHDTWNGKGVAVVAVYNGASLEELDQRWAEMNQRFGGVPEVPFRVAIDGDATPGQQGISKGRSGATHQRYGITSYPTDILIDPAGNVVGQPHVSRAKEAISQMLETQP